MSTITIFCKILAIQQNQYTDIVVEDLNRDSYDDLHYVTVTRVPNWIGPLPNIGDTGYLEFECVRAGTTYFNRNTERSEFFKYNGNYFIGFIKKQELCKQDKFDFE